MTSPARVLLLHHVTTMSGAEQGLLDVARALRQAGHEVQLGLPSGGALVDRANGEGFPTHDLPLSRVYRTRNPLALAAVAGRLSRASLSIRRIVRNSRINVLHCNSDTAMLFAAASWSRVPCIWHRRDLVELGKVGDWLGRRASRIVCISHCVADASRRYADADRNVRTLYNGINTERLQPVRLCQSVRDALGIPVDAIVVANIGQLIPWKRQETFIAAAHAVAEELPNTHFLLIGSDLFDDHPEYVRSLQQAAAHGPGAGRILFTGYRHDIGDLLGATDIVVHAAAREPFGRALAEAMAMGLPVVAPDACGPAELIEDTVSGQLFPPGDVPAMARAIAALARDPAERQRLGRAARERVESRFSIETFTQGLADVYEDIADTAEAT